MSDNRNSLIFGSIDLAEHNRHALFKIKGTTPIESANNDESAKTPDEDLRILENLISNFKTQRLRG